MEICRKVRLTIRKMETPLPTLSTKDRSIRFIFDLDKSKIIYSTHWIVKRLLTNTFVQYLVELSIVI